MLKKYDEIRFSLTLVKKKHPWPRVLFYIVNLILDVKSGSYAQGKLIINVIPNVSFIIAIFC